MKSVNAILFINNVTLYDSISFLKDYLKRYPNYSLSNINGAECSFCLGTNYGILTLYLKKLSDVKILIGFIKMLIILGYEHAPSCRKKNAFFGRQRMGTNRSAICVT